MAFDLAYDSTAGSAPVKISAGVVSNQARPAPARMPALIPASELYFWSERWQDMERTFERDRAAGNLIEAGSMDEVIHELMRVDPDE